MIVTICGDLYVGILELDGHGMGVVRILMGDSNVFLNNPLEVWVSFCPGEVSVAVMTTPRAAHRLIGPSIPRWTFLLFPFSDRSTSTVWASPNLPDLPSSARYGSMLKKNFIHLFCFIFKTDFQAEREAMC